MGTVGTVQTHGTEMVPDVDGRGSIAAAHAAEETSALDFRVDLMPDLKPGESTDLIMDSRPDMRPRIIMIMAVRTDARADVAAAVTV